MRIEELEEGDSDRGDEGSKSGDGGQITGWRKALVGIGAQGLFYPTIAFNVINRWDKVDEFLLLGAVPFHSDIPRLKQLGVCGVITLKEPFETLVDTSVYADYEIEHLVIPTRDYLFAPSFKDTSKAVDFIHKNASSGRTTYVHCKAGRGCSTTIVMCYLMKHKQMSPNAALAHIKKSRRQVRLADAQWETIYHCLNVNPTGRDISYENPDDASYVVVSQDHLAGYNDEAINVDNRRWVELGLARRALIGRLALMGRLAALSRRGAEFIRRRGGT